MLVASSLSRSWLELFTKICLLCLIRAKHFARCPPDLLSCRLMSQFCPLLPETLELWMLRPSKQSSLFLWLGPWTNCRRRNPVVPSSSFTRLPGDYQWMTHPSWRSACSANGYTWKSSSWWTKTRQMESFCDPSNHLYWSHPKMTHKHDRKH